MRSNVSQSLYIFIFIMMKVFRIPDIQINIDLDCSTILSSERK